MNTVFTYTNRIVIVGFFLIYLLNVRSAYAENIIAFGDSLTEGCGIPGVYYYSCGWQGRDDTYPLYFENYASNDNIEVNVINYGIGGQTTDDGLARIDSVLNDPCNPDIDYMFVLFGTNDLFHHTDETVIVYNLRLMISKIRAEGIVPVIATVTPDPDHEWKNITLLNEYIRSLAVDEDVLLVDLYSEMATSWYYYTNPEGCYMDQLHPNPLGFQKMADVWYQSMYDLLKTTTLPWLPILLK